MLIDEDTVKLRYRDVIIDIAVKARLPLHDVARVLELFADKVSAARDGRDVGVVVTEEIKENEL